MSDPITPVADPAVTPPPAPPAPPWYAARNDANFTGYLQTRGWDKKTPEEAAHEAYKSHNEAQQMISRLTGTPDKDRILITPKPDATEAEKNAYYEKLGRPSKADDYDFKSIKFPDGSELDDDFVGVLRNAAFKANASKDQAAQIAKDLVDWMGKADEAESTVMAGKIAAEKSELLKSWGPNAEANKFIAQQGALKLGWTPEQIQALQNGLGYKAVMEAALKAGLAFGEDKFIANRTPGTQGVMTKEQAGARLKELRMDKAWADKLMKGDRQANDEFNALTAMMVGQAA